MLQFRRHEVEGIRVVEFTPFGLSGDASWEDLSYALQDLLVRSESKRMVLDLAQVQRISSPALGALVTLNQMVGGLNGKLALCGVRDQVRQVFRITAVDRLFAFCETQDEAVACMRDDLDG